MLLRFDITTQPIIVKFCINVVSGTKRLLLWAIFIIKADFHYCGAKPWGELDNNTSLGLIVKKIKSP